jgi:hypothetical protein
MNTDFASWLRYRADEGMDVRGVFERRVVCPCCNGRGVTVHGFGGRYGGAYASYTADEWHEMGEETQEMYRDGTFDAPCPDCGGANVVLELDREASNAALVADWDAYCQEIWECEAAHRQEIAMGC